jgi:anti-sigma regulatory factor (Ser/Thr protein kinase)
MRVQDAEHNILVSNDLNEITVVMEAFDAFAASCAVPAAIATRFCLIFDEMLSNIIYYGYPEPAGQKSSREIRVAMQRRGEQVSVTISDDGIPFDPFAATPPNVDLPLEDREIGGLGIHMVRNMVHHAHYRREDGRNIITLIQQLN